MKLKRVLIFIFLSTQLLFGNPLAKVYNVDDPLLKTIEELSLESKINPFSSAGPISGYELKSHLEKINIELLSTDSKTKYEDVLIKISNPFKLSLWNYNLILTQEGYFNTNKQFKYYDWVEGYNQRSPFAYGEVETIFGQNAYGIISYSYQKAFSEKDFNGFNLNNPETFSGTGTSVQDSVPHKAFISFSNEWSSLILGRDAISFGRGSTGNLMLNNHVPYHDFILLNLFNKKFRYSFLVLPMNELISEEIQNNNGLDGSLLGQALIPYKKDSFWHTLFHGTNRRTYMSHRFEIDIAKRWRLAITEGTLFYTDTLDLRMLNPLMFLHNLQNFGEVNNSFGVETEITLSNKWALDIQVFLDQFQTAGEQDTSDPIPPNAYAFLVGARYNYLFNNWSIKGFLEGVYTSPFVYLRTGDQTANYGDEDPEKQYNLDFVHAVTMADGKSGVNWLGYPHGPDSIVFSSSTTISYKNLLSLTNTIKFIVEGERGLFIHGKEQLVVEQYAKDINMPTPSGPNPIYSINIGLGINFNIPKTNGSIYANNYWIEKWSSNSYESDYQLTIGIRYNF